VVYGLLAVCMVWAPRNELNCIAILLFGFRTFVFHWDLYYTTVAILYIGEQLVGLVFWGALGGMLMISEMGHLSGAFWGTVVAIVLLKAKLVDCEGWDLFSLWTKRRELAADWQKRGEYLDRHRENIQSAVKANVRRKRPNIAGAGAADGSTRRERGAAAVRRIRKLIDDGDVSGALEAYASSARTLFDWPSQSDLYELIKAMHARGAESDSIRMMRDHCRFYPGESSRMRLKLAQVLIRDLERPAAALRVLAEITPGSLPADLEATRQKLTRKADRLRAEGVLELEGDD
jgi:hypothetical protein